MLHNISILTIFETSERRSSFADLIQKQKLSRLFIVFCPIAIDVLVAHSHFKCLIKIGVLVAYSHFKYLSTIAVMLSFLVFSITNTISQQINVTNGPSSNLC